MGGGREGWTESLKSRLVQEDTTTEGGQLLDGQTVRVTGCTIFHKADKGRPGIMGDLRTARPGEEGEERCEWEDDK